MAVTLVARFKRRMGLTSILISVFLLAAGCDRYPEDPQGSLEVAKLHGLKVGVTHTVLPGRGELPGREVDLIKGFADQLGTDIRWTQGSESHLLRILQEGELHLVLGGITSKSPWRTHLGLSKPYYKEQVVVCSTDETPIPKNLEGVTVAAQSGSWHLADLKRRGARPTSVDVLSKHEGLVAVDMHELDDVGCGDATHLLTRHKHVAAVPKGENALLVAFEEYLHEQGY